MKLLPVLESWFREPYCLAELPDIKPRSHIVTAVARHLETKQEVTQQVGFDI